LGERGTSAGRVAALAHRQAEIDQRPEVVRIALQHGQVRRRRFVRAVVFEAIRALEEHIHRIRALDQTPVDLGEMPLVAILPGRNPQVPSTVSRAI
jgi:hypothetical protein